MTSLFLITALSATSPISAPRSEMLVDAAIRPIAGLRIVFPNTPIGRQAKARYEAHATRGEIPGPGTGGGYAIGKTADGIAVETRLSFGDNILQPLVPVTRLGNHLTLHFEWCRQQATPWKGLPHVMSGRLHLFVVQWLIHDIPAANYQVSFQGTDIGTCPETGSNAAEHRRSQ